MKRHMIAFICVGVVIGGGIAAYYVLHSSTPNATLPILANQGIITNLPQKDASKIDTSHLAEDIMPPTNKWFSGIALQAVPKTVFPTPLSFTPSDTGFTIDLPDVDTTQKSILSIPSSPTTVSIELATHYRITRYDEMSVDLTYMAAGGAPLVTVTIAAGSPYVFVAAKQSTVVKIAAPKLEKENGSVSLVSKGALSAIHATGFDGTTIIQSDTNITSSIPTGGLLSFYAVPSIQSQHSDALKAAADARITGIDINYTRNDAAYKTQAKITTSNDQPTIYGYLPHQTTTQSSLFSIDTLYGQQQFRRSNTIAFTTPIIPVTDELDVTTINDADRQLLTTQLRHDINATQMTAEDTYFGGKQLYRSAQLLQLAHQLNETAIASTIQQKLHTEITTWLKQPDGRAKQFFYYDSKIKGIVGETPSFGSDEFNDHHFHYGYFIYAASILAKYDPVFKQQYQPMVDVLVADIANYTSTSSLPLRRNFDPYFGHSWASGSSPFNDGNNQESASEAMNAWIGVSLWATQTDNKQLRDQADWMLSNEVASTYAYWLNFDQTAAPYNKNYQHTIAPLNWGGKRDYATFFSGEPSAMLGILLIPMNPTMVTFRSLDQRIDTVVNEAFPTPESDNAQFADYILMLSSLHGMKNQLDRAKSLDDKFIDDANSRSYLYAWIMSRK